MQTDGIFRDYFIGVSFLPEFSGSIVLFGRSDAELSQEFVPPKSGERVAVLPYDNRQEDTILQIDVFGDHIEGRYWRPGDPVPTESQFELFDDA